MFERGEQLLKQIEASADDEAASSLLKEFFAGYSIDNLRRLLESKDEGAVRVGAWIASELGSQVCPLISAIRPLLTHASRYVRFFALDPVLVCAGTSDGPLVAAAVGLLRDSDDAVRWKAMSFVVKAMKEQLGSSVASQGDNELAGFTNWLISLEDQPGRSSRIIDSLGASTQLERVFAAAAAARFADKDAGPLQRASVSSDKEIRSFAEEQLRMLQ
jgi:hypothetical protein